MLNTGIFGALSTLKVGVEILVVTLAIINGVISGILWIALGLVYHSFTATRARRSTTVRVVPVPSKKETRLFRAGLILGAILTNLPISLWAQKYSTTAYLVDNVLLVLGCVPLLLLGLPRSLISKWTRPRLFDLVLSRLTRAIPATLIFSGSLLVSMLSPVVELQATNSLVRAALQLELVFAAIIMWIPAFRLLPGMRQLSTAGRIAYLFAQSLLPSFPAFVLIFASHPFYPTFAAHMSSLGISAVGDQELAGGLSKILSIALLWGTAIVILLRANQSEELGQDPEPITWDDVERELDRTERRAPRQG